MLRNQRLPVLRAPSPDEQQHNRCPVSLDLPVREYSSSHPVHSVSDSSDSLLEEDSCDCATSSSDTQEIATPDINSSESSFTPASTSPSESTSLVPIRTSTINDSSDRPAGSFQIPQSSTAPLYLHLTTPPESRFRPSSFSSFLQPGRRFVGTQRSERLCFNVEVEIQHVSLADCTLSGYLRIDNLTCDHATLRTFFEGELIGDKYTFVTGHPEWGSTEKNDFKHWDCFKPYRRQYATNPRRKRRDWMRKEDVFMRWKERFLVPDHRVKALNGASFEGFYYIWFSQVTGCIEGVYYHQTSEKGQMLYLEPAPGRFEMPAFEFR